MPLATKKLAQIRYKTLEMCFRNPGKRFAIEDLVAACNEAIYEFTGKEEGFKKTQFQYTNAKRKSSLRSKRIYLRRSRSNQPTIRYINSKKLKVVNASCHFFSDH